MSFVSIKKGEILEEHEKLFGFTPDPTYVSVEGLKERISDERPIELRVIASADIRSELAAVDAGKIPFRASDVRATSPLRDVCS